MAFADRLLPLILGIAALAGAPRIAGAQRPKPAPSLDANVGAEALFREGRALMKENKISEACDKFEASNRLDESIGTLLNLADCREKNGQLATAWATFLKAASAARGSDPSRETVARGRASKLEPRLSYLTISVPDASHIEGLSIKRNGVELDPALWNQGVPVDAGSYEITGQAPGHEPWSTKLDVHGEAQKASVEVPRFKQLKDLSKAVAAKPEPTATVATKVASRPEGDDEDHDTESARPGRFTSLRKVSIAAAVVGVAGIAGGVAFGLQAKDLQNQSNAICPATQCGDQHALDLNTKAKHDALASDILFGVGGAAVAGAVVLWIVGAPSHASEAVSVAPLVGRGQIGLAFGGGF